MSRIIRISQIRCVIILFHGFSIHLFGKAPGTSKVIFRSCSADGRILLISVNIKLHFSLAPPVTFQCGKCHVGSYIMAFSFYSIQNCIIFCFFCQPFPSPLRMEISNIVRKLIIETVIYLIKESRDFICMLVFQCDLCFLLKRHREIAVKAPVWNNSHRNRIYKTFSSESAAEEITQRTFHGRSFLVIPVHTDHKIPQYKAICLCSLVVDGDPNMIDLSRSFHFCQSYHSSRLNILKTRASFSGRSEMTCSHTASAFFSMRIFCVDRTAFSMLCKCDSSQSACKCLIHICFLLSFGN